MFDSNLRDSKNRPISKRHLCVFYLRRAGWTTKDIAEALKTTSEYVFVVDSKTRQRLGLPSFRVERKNLISSKLEDLDLEDIGVDGSIHRRIHDLVVSFGAKLIGIETDALGTSVSMIFDEDTYISTVSIVDSLKPICIKGNAKT